ncbi:ABC transporter permease [Actinotalea solisilvae]|uniref:ABC transporter permease n=1 Tax=Actinotalea solisilvae TaxID=2072922 RepID=UPI0018F20912|nr:ABC-2 family transporter protein [Actinotalea solisilvae]
MAEPRPARTGIPPSAAVADRPAVVRGPVRRALWLYRRSLGAKIRSVMEYEADFWILMLAAVLTQGVGLVFLWTVFRRIPDINGWGFWEIVIVYAMVYLAEGVGSLFFEGTWRLAWLVNQGELDRVLLRPFSPVLQVMSIDVGLNGLGNITMGIALLVAAVQQVDVAWSVGKVVLALVLLLSGIAVKIGLNLASNASAFWINAPFSTFAFSLHSLGELARFPITIYALGIRAVITFVLPFAFVSFFPAAAVLGHGTSAWVGLLTPLVAAYCVGMGIWLFRRGLRRYESAGA